MTSDFYFFDQFSRASHIGGVRRIKRDSKDFNQALYHVQIILSHQDDHSPIQIKKQTDDPSLQKRFHQFKKSILPQTLTKQLDTVLQNFDDKSKSNSPSSDRSKSPDEQEFPNQPKVSLPSSLILQLHSTWSDLIKNTNYKYKVWRTKAAEEAWHQHLKRKRSEQLNPEKIKDISDDKPIIQRRTSSRISISSTTNLPHRQSITNLTHRQSITANSRVRWSRSFSRASFLSASHSLQDSLRLAKAMHQRNSEYFVEPIKNGIHVEFKLSTQDDDEGKQKIVLFDVPKPDVNLGEDIIALNQNKCKCLLAEAKQKILETIDDDNKKHSKVCRIWFYEDNLYIRNKNRLISNELNRRPKSKFALSILRYEIPEKYNIDIDIPATKQKCYIELRDGSTQIYYPSGRLAVLRLRPSFSTTLFFDDTDSPTKQFLGLVTSNGNVLLMQPTFHARFVTNNKHKIGYLCNGKTGIIEKEFQLDLPNNYQKKSISIDEDNINPPIIENTVQIQINSFMQLEYHNSSNILFAFTCQNENFQFQLGSQLPPQPSKLMNLTKAILATSKISGEKKSHFFTKSSNSSDSANISEKQHIQTHPHQLPIMQELTSLRKRIKDICDNWLKECRTTLGVMDIDAYCLSDLPPQPIIKQTKQKMDDINLSKSPVQFNLRTSINSPQLLTRKLESNAIANVIEQFVPRSASGRAIKQRIYTKKILPVIK